MRALFTKVLTGSMVASAALMVSACGGNTEPATDNTMITDMNATEGMDTMSDNMTAVDGAMGSNDMMMSNDMMGSNAMMSNDMMSNNAMMSNDMMMNSSTPR